jgi:tRNA (guanine10-N2)-dimethyltransferase
MQHKSLLILGRQPAIGRAELESILGAQHLEAVGDLAMASDLSVAQIPFGRIGSSIRLAKPVTILQTVKWSVIVEEIAKLFPALLDEQSSGKVTLGLSVYGLPVSLNDLLHGSLVLKKVCKRQGRPLRFVPNTAPTLNSGQVIHNQLTDNLGLELLFIKDGAHTYVAQTIAIQDIEAYAERDQKRPKRDAFVGMAPPKLAQTIVNLGVGQLPPGTDRVILDPFCGTGVILQEALLMGYGAYGSDLEPRMVEYARTNLEWLGTSGSIVSPVLEVGDAATHTWDKPISAVASETYLGQPLSSWPSPETLQKIMSKCGTIIQQFLTNVAPQLPDGMRLCLGIPAWHAPTGQTYRLPLLDQLAPLGYNCVSFSFASSEEMIYRRPDQVVGRELLVITRNTRKHVTR